ncbi:MAG: AIR synthase related protein, partial [Bacillota bacterium]
ACSNAAAPGATPEKGIALKADGNGRYCYLDPVQGGAIAVAEAARNIACTGARPLAVTNCLNFGNPEKPDVFWQFRGVIEGMGKACRALGTPVTGGNVSFYNESRDRAIYPTPVIGMVGLIDDISRILRPGFRSAGDYVILLGETRDELGGSEYLKVVHGMVAGRPPAVDLEREKRLIDVLLEANLRGLLESAHDVSDGGLAVALAECCFAAAPGAGGADILLQWEGRPDALLFSESQSRAIVTARPRAADGLLSLCRERNLPCSIAGRVTGTRLRIASQGGGEARPLINCDTASLGRAWREAIPCLMG